MKTTARPFLLTWSAAITACAATFGSTQASPFGLQAGAIGSSSLVMTIASPGVSYGDGAFTGPSTDAYYGQLQVRANLQNGRLVSVEVLDYPDHSRTSRRINDRALPQLQSEAIQAQSGKVDIISGATLTSRAYQRSLKAALAKAGQ